MVSKLTEEEEILKKQFATLRKLKKELKQLTLKRKQEQAAAAENGPPSAKQKKVIIQGNAPAKSPEFTTGGFNFKTKAIKSWDTAANTEAAKKLLKTGAVQIKLKNKTTFKRSSNLKRKLIEMEGQPRKPVFQPFSVGESTEEDAVEEVSKEDKKEKTGFTSPTSNLKSPEQGKDTKPRFNRRDRRTERKAPRRGNTLYVHGAGVSEKLIRASFSKFGNIVNISMESGKNSGFVSYDTYEAAEEAINALDESCVDDCRLKVSLARRQPMLESVKASTPWANLAERGDKGSAVADSRVPLKYDEDYIF